MTTQAASFFGLANAYRPRRRLSLLLRFSLVAFILLVVLGLALALGMQAQLEQSALRQEATNAADQVERLLRPLVHQADLQGAFSPALIRQIDGLVHQDILGRQNVRVKIWGPDGTVLYADHPDLIGRRFAVDDVMAAALAGQFGTDVSDLTDPENVDERSQFQQLLEIYVPLRPADSPAVGGAYEVYQDMAVLQPRIDEIRRFVWVGVSTSFLILYAGLFTLVRGASRSLTRQGAAQQMSEKRFRAIFEEAAVGMVLLDRDGRILEANHALHEMFAYPAGQLPGQSLAALAARGDGADDIARVTEIVEGRRPRYQVEKHYRRRDGSMVWARLTASPLPGERGRPEFVVAMIEDESARKAAQDATRRQLERLAALRTIDMAITSSLDLRVTLSVVFEKVSNLLQVDAVHVLLLNPHTQILESAGGRGFRTGAVAHRRVRLGEGHAGTAALERRTIHVADLGTQVPSRATGMLVREEFVTYFAVPLLAKGQVKGVLEVYHRSRLDPDLEWLDFLEALAGQAAIAVDNATLFSDLQRTNLRLALAYDTTLEGWSRALDLRDKETQGHTQRVTERTIVLARAMGMSEPELVQVRRGALLHDIGKMGIPDAILLKPGPLTDEEWVIMRRHPDYALELLAPIEFLGPALVIPYCHHERWDGSGYPRGLRGEQIPLPARIFSVIDVWDALSSDRPYRAAWAEERVRAYIRERAGHDFDPRVVEAFLALEA